MKNPLRHWRDALTILSLFLALLAILACFLLLANTFNVAFTDWLPHSEQPVRIPN